jgi:hypothetical protein
VERRVLIGGLFDVTAEVRGRGDPRVEEQALNETEALGIQRKPVGSETGTR